MQRPIASCLRLVACLATLCAITAIAQQWDGKLFDSHAHLLADDTTRYPQNPQPPPSASDGRMPPGVAGQPGGKAGPNPVKAVPDATRMLVWMRENNVEGIVAVQRRNTYRFDNSYILDSAAKYPTLMRTMVVLDAQDRETPDTIDDLILHHDLAGVRIAGGQGTNGATPWLDSPQALKTWAAIDEVHSVIDLEINGPNGGLPFIPSIIALSNAYPNATIVLDHLLEPQIRRTPDFGLDDHYRTLARQKNVYVKFTTLNLDLCREYDVDCSLLLRKAIETFGAGHILWGSDIGTSSGTYKEMIIRILSVAANLTPNEKRAILHDNATNLFARR
jgi:L-fuconolactonase